MKWHDHLAHALLDKTFGKVKKRKNFNSPLFDCPLLSMLKIPLIKAYNAETHLTKTTKREGKDNWQRPCDWFLTKRTNSVADESLKHNFCYLKVRKKIKKKEITEPNWNVKGSVWKIIRRAVIIKARLIAADRITFSRHQDNKTPFLFHTRMHTLLRTYKIQDQCQRSGSIAVGHVWTIW